MFPIFQIPITSGVCKRGGCTYGLIYANRKYNLLMVKGLFFNLVFQGIKVYEFLLLDQYISTKWETLKAEERFAYIALLSLSGERRRPSLQWESNIRRTLRQVRNYSRLDIFGAKENFLDFLLKNNLIKKVPQLKTDFRKAYKFHKLPLPIASMGKGYKDKGSSSLPNGYDSTMDTKLLMQLGSFNESSSNYSASSYSDALENWRNSFQKEEDTGST